MEAERVAFVSQPVVDAVTEVLAGLTTGWLTEEELAEPPEEAEEWSPEVRTGEQTPFLVRGAGGIEAAAGLLQLAAELHTFLVSKVHGMVCSAGTPWTACVAAQWACPVAKHTIERVCE